MRGLVIPIRTAGKVKIGPDIIVNHDKNGSFSRKTKIEIVPKYKCQAPINIPRTRYTYLYDKVIFFMGCT